MKWEKITNYENYIINEKGEIINIINNKKIKQYKGKDGYIRVYLYKKCKKKAFLIHRLIAQAFIPNPYNYFEVNHKNENKSDNNINNLEWCNRKYNMNYGTTQQRKSKNKCKKVNQYDLKGNFIKQWNSIKEAGETLNIHKGSISWCCKGIYKNTHGYVFKYNNIEEV